MLAYNEAVTKILNEAEQIAHLEATRRSEFVSLENAVGRVNFSEILSPEILPALPTSAMDGFAVKSSDVQNASPEAPTALKILGSIAAGDFLGQPTISFANSSAKVAAAYEIMTGASFPDGFDACIRIEDVETKNGLVYVHKPVSFGHNRRAAGEDFRIGTLILKRGQIIRAEDLLPLNALGITQLQVYKKLRVAIISTGKELVECNTHPQLGQIRNSTSTYIKASLKKFGVEVGCVANVGDDVDDFKKKVSALQNDYDLILTTGAISVGKYDFVTDAIKELGAEIFFKKVAIRPGKPLLLAHLSLGPYIFCLPGNPLATAVGLRFFVKPFIDALMHQPRELSYRAKLSTTTRATLGTTTFLKGILSQALDGSLTVSPASDQRASLLHPLLESNCWLELTSATNQDSTEPAEFTAGTEINAYLF